MVSSQFYTRFITTLLIFILTVKEGITIAISPRWSDDVVKRQSFLNPTIGSAYTQMNAGMSVEIRGFYFDASTLTSSTKAVFTMDSNTLITPAGGVSITIVRPGTFVCTITIPSITTPGNHILTAEVGTVKVTYSIVVCDSTGSGCAPKISFLDPKTLITTGLDVFTVGEEFIVVGDNFVHGKVVEFWVDRYFSHGKSGITGGVKLGEAIADNINGHVRSRKFKMPAVSVPWPLYGTHYLSAVGQSDGASLSFTIEA